MLEITSIQNPRIQKLRALKSKRARQEQQATLVEGRKMVAEALALGLVSTLVIGKEWAAEYTDLQEAAETLLVPDYVLAALVHSKSPQGIAAEIRLPQTVLPCEGKLLALEQVQDPGNVGAMIRTADAAGWSGVLLGAGCADPYGPKTLRATMGSIFRVPLVTGLNLVDQLRIYREAGFAVCGAALSGEPVFETKLPKAPLILAIGNESAGLTEEVLTVCTHRFRLPMQGGAESLNAAVAAGILMYQWVREESIWSR